LADSLAASVKTILYLLEIWSHCLRSSTECICGIFYASHYRFRLLDAHPQTSILQQDR